MSQKTKDVNWKKSQILYPEIYALITMESESEDHINQFWNLNQLSNNLEIYELVPGCWIFFSDSEEFVFPTPFPNTTLLCISDVNGMNYEELGRLLRNYKTAQFFYDYQPVNAINHKRAYELKEDRYIANEADLDKLKEEWRSLNWVYENSLFEKITFDLKNSKLKFSSLYHLLLSLENVWNTSYGKLFGESVELPPTFHCWSEVEDWLSYIFQKTNMFSASSKYSPEVTQNILSAKLYVDSHHSSALETAKVSRNAHMSYGYFSRCFHDIIGMPFSEYCTQMRMDKAKEYLLHTANPIQQIARNVGYNDEKYFSRIFRKQIGVSPSEFCPSGYKPRSISLAD